MENTFKNVSSEALLEDILNFEEPTAENMAIVEAEMEIPYLETDYTLNDKYSGTCLMYTDEIQKYPLATPEEIIEMVHRRDQAKADSDEYYLARNEIVIANLRLVVSWAYKYSHDSMVVADYIQAGNLGLMVAAGKFQPKKNCRFSTYASWWIKQAILRYIALDHLMHIPVYANSNFMKVIRFKNSYLMEFHEEPTLAEISKQVGISIEDICRLTNTISLDSIERPLASEDEDSDPLKNFLISDEDVENTVITKMTKETLYSSLNLYLSERERKVLILRFGLNGKQPKTLEQVGKEFNITRERVRQIESRAINKLRHNRKFEKDFCPAFLKKAQSYAS